MKLQKTHCGLIMMVVTTLVVYSCGNADVQSANVQDTVCPETTCDNIYDDDQERSDMYADSMMDESELEIIEEEVEPAPKPAAKPAAKKTIYVSGYGANGEVWGHVTMTGNKGRGTIHDSEENTLSVTCYKQGDELIAVDQNSRQYVFKI